MNDRSAARWMVLGAAALGALLAWLLVMAPPSTPEPAPEADPAAVAPAPKPASRATRAPGASTALPRPGPPKRDPPVALEPAANAGVEDPSNDDDLTSNDSPEARRPTRTLTPEDGPAMLRSVMQDEVAPEILKCMEEWHAEFPDASGRVIMGFTLGPDGLSDARIEEYTDLPVGLLSCVSAAVWEGDWPANPDGALEVRYPIELEMGGEGG